VMETKGGSERSRTRCKDKELWGHSITAHKILTEMCVVMTNKESEVLKWIGYDLS
jgi:hypothetical protein